MKKIIIVFIAGLLLLVLPQIVIADVSFDCSFDHDNIMEGDSVTATWTITGAKEPLRNFAARLNGYTSDGGFITFTSTSDATANSITCDNVYGASILLYISFSDADGVYYTYVSPSTSIIESTAQVVYSGIWGKNIEWNLDDKGLLTISGSGEMDSFNGDEDNSAWRQYMSSIRQIVICDGVTSISSYAFYEFAGRITIPDSVVSFGTNCFGDEDSYSISARIICNFDSQAAHYASNLFVEYGLFKLGFSTPNTIERIAYLYDSTGQVIGLELLGINDASWHNSITYVVPEYITQIGVYALSNENLQNIILQNHIKDISPLAFFNCINLTSITIPASVNNFSGAFVGCTNLSKIMILGDDTTFDNDTAAYNPVIYCYKYSSTDAWALQNDYHNIVYIDDIPDIDSISSIILEEDFCVYSGETHTLNYNLFPIKENTEVIWTSSNPQVATVENGILLGHEPGMTTITLNYGSVSQSVNVQVYLVATSIELNHNELWTIAQTEPKPQMIVTDFFPDGAWAEISWYSSNSNYATIDNNGYLTTYRPGDVVITATTEHNTSQSCLVHICYPVTAIEYSKPIYFCNIDDMIQLEANVSMRTQNCINHLVAFTSNNEAVATVDEFGAVHGISHGTAIITATAESGVSATTEVRVHELEQHDRIEPTCTTQGTDVYWMCTICNRLFSDENGENEIDAPIKLALAEHQWTDARYRWAADNSSVSASRVCIMCTAIEQDTAAVVPAIVSPTDDNEGLANYTSDNFIYSAFTAQTKSITIPALYNMSVIWLPNMLTTIEDEAFENLSCEAIIIPDSCNSIGNNAFRNCNNLKYVRVPAGVEFPADAFKGCEDVVVDRVSE